MIFVDQAKIFLKAGNGGKGCESHYQDKYTKPTPDGGDGGKGGDIIFVSDKGIQTLLDFRFKQHYQAPSGGHASSKGKKGRSGGHCYLRVPVGTLIYDDATGLLIRDLSQAGEEVVVVRGGYGGIGNRKGKTPKPPQPGKELKVRLELKLVADVGLVGFPNAGKSTLISNISKVKSKIANYPFTTKQPILGIVRGEEFDFAVADLPGLIEGAHRGRGLGDRFLRHAERTKVIVHIIDMAGSEGRDPVLDYRQINKELKAYSEEFEGKPKIVVANKMDLPEAAENLKKFKKKVRVKIFSVSALEKSGLEELVEHIRTVLCQENSHVPSKE